MGAKVQSKTYFPGSMRDINNGFHNGIWDPHLDDRSLKISGPGNSQHYDYFLMRQAMDGYTGYAKEQIRQTILKHESIFRHQLQELHRLYKRHRDLMNPLRKETLNLGHFLSQVSSDIPKEANIFSSSMPLDNSTFSPFNSIKGKTSLKDIGVSERRVIDLELSANVNERNQWKQKVGNFQILKKEKGFNLADLNEPPVQVEEAGFSAFVGNNNNIIITSFPAEELQKKDSSTKRTLFGVEIFEGNHTSTFHSSNNHCLSSIDSTRQNPSFFAGNSRSIPNSMSQNPSSAIGALNISNLKDSVSNSLEEICTREKHTFLNMWKNHETPERALPPWLTAKPCLQHEQTKGKQTTVHHISLDSLQNRSQQFFKKRAEMAEGDDTREFKKVKSDDTQIIPKILGVPIIDKKVESHKMKDLIDEKGGRNYGSDMRQHIDLNLSLDEDDSSPVALSFPESIVKIATMEIDLEAPAALESNNSPEIFLDDDNGTMDTHFELVKAAAEAIISISSSKPLTIPDTHYSPQESSFNTLLWFADMITSKDFKNSSVDLDSESVPQGMDYFEYITLKLEDTKEDYDNYKPMIVEDEEKEEENVTSSKRTPRKGQGRRGRQRKDFQKDILPNIVSLSRREVTEDLQIFEDALSATGVSWQSSLSKRKAAARNVRGRRRSVVPGPSCSPPPPPPPPPPPLPPVEQTLFREISLEKTLGGWGRRTRRLPRQRCQNEGNHHQSLALKC